MKKIILSIACFALNFAGVWANDLYSAGTNKSIPLPKFGQYTVGDDYFLANYKQLIDYWSTLEKLSDRIKLVDFGLTPEGRTMKLSIITSPENHKNLKRYQEISVKLAKAEGLTDDDAKTLAAEGKTVVWIDGGLHSTEAINAQLLFVQAYDLLARDDEETKNILDNVILLLVPANPDGMDLVSDWYMQESDPLKRNMAIPRLYQKYVGHDNNRDSYIANQLETEAINRQMYIEWIPQIMYNQHQSGPAGTVLFMAPFRDPFNYNQDPLVPLGIDLVGAAVHNRFLAEGKAGAVLRDAAPFSTWFNGGDRTTVGFHNQIGLLSEIIGNPTPVSSPFLTSRILASGVNPLPIGPKEKWYQHQSIEYIVSADRAILDIAARLREEFLFRIYRAGKNSIEKGSRDNWTLTPKRIAVIEAEYEQYLKDNPDKKPEDTRSNRLGNYYGPGLPTEYWNKLHTPEARDPRGYIVPADQADFLTATKFINALLKAGVDVHRATADFTVAGKTYPTGSYVVKAAQAFRPHLRDMFEPQDHPNDFQYPGGPPKPPYDLAGYTLAFQMGVQFDRILDGFDGPFEKIEVLVKPKAGKVNYTTKPAGYLLNHQINDAFTATTKLLAAGEEVYWLKQVFSANGKTYPIGTIYIPAKSSTLAQVQKLAAEIGLDFEGIVAKPQGDALKLNKVRVALWDRYGGSMDSGWIRWLFEQQFPFPFDVVYPQTLDEAKLRKKYDVLILPPGAFPQKDRQNFRQPQIPENLPDEYKTRTGNISLEKTAPQLRKFVEDGGVVLTLGNSTEFGYYLELPIENALTDQTGRKLDAEKYYIPGSVLRVKVDNTRPIAYGLPEDLDIFYNNSPVFRLKHDAKEKDVNGIAWFPTAEPLRSGWAWGQEYLKDATAIVEAQVGKGKVYLFGPEVTFRAQPHGTFKFLFNGIYSAGAKDVKLK
ncbi:MAG: hypothetical protein LBS25_10125 [Candidatus Symbiothrix sp.]|nr:hypothetical protein [Candidatus Symbiothrix sp.]